jgi:protein-tyrosine-phosphatase
LAEGILASKLPATKFTVDSAGTEIGTLAMLLTHVRLRRQKITTSIFLIKSTSIHRF